MKTLPTAVVIRNVDDLGRIVIPKTYRESLGLDSGIPVELMPTEEGLLLRRAHALCDNCRELASRQVENLRFCEACMKRIVAAQTV